MARSDDGPVLDRLAAGRAPADRPGWRRGYSAGSATVRQVTHADLSGLAKGWNEIVVDGRGNTYVGEQRLRVQSRRTVHSGVSALVAPDGSVRHVADDIHFLNGMVVTPDNETSS